MRFFLLSLLDFLPKKPGDDGLAADSGGNIAVFNRDFLRQLLTIVARFCIITTTNTPALF